MVETSSISLVGRPNAGKSTLFNYLVSKKASIVSPKANTTRFSSAERYHDSSGVDVCVVDTPGWERTPRGDLGRVLLGAARSAFMAARVVGLVIDAARPITEHDRALYNEACCHNKPVEVILSKIDLVKPRAALLPKIAEIQSWGYPGVVWLVSSRSGSGVDKLRAAILAHSAENLTEEAVVTQMTPQRFAEECVREHAFKLLNQEVPYGMWVETKWMREGEDGVLDIEQDIKILNKRHKSIILGAGGQMIKKIGTRARMELMHCWGKKVRLHIVVKVGAKEELLVSCRQ